MTKHLAFLPLLFCAACAPIPYEPQPLEVHNTDIYAADVAFCQAAAATVKLKASSGSIAYGALSGGVGTIAYAPINPAIPVLGAVGGAANAAGAGFDITGTARRNVAKHCLEDRVHMDQSAIVANPDN